MRNSRKDRAVCRQEEPTSLSTVVDSDLVCDHERVGATEHHLHEYDTTKTARKLTPNRRRERQVEQGNDEGAADTKMFALLVSISSME